MKKTSRSLLAVLMAAILTVFMAGAVFAADATLGIDGDPTETGSLIPAWEGKGVDSTFYIGVEVAGEDVSGILADQAEVVDGVVTVEGVNVTSELGDALNDLGATNTTYMYVNGGEADTEAIVKDSTFVFSDNSDGKNANDFTGLGVVFVATGSEDTNTNLTLQNVDIKTDGFSRDAVVVDAYANAFVIDSNIETLGNNPLTEVYEGYASNAAQAYMVSPPWILGIYGGVRAANTLGTNSTFNLINSTMTTGGWAVISTDDCTHPTVNVLNSKMIVKEYDGEDVTGSDSSDSMNGGAALFGYDRNYGSAYGTYNIGSSYEYFYGAEIDGTTYATILTGAGPTYFGASYDGLELINGETGEVLYVYEGEGQPTVVNSVFGVMDHQGAADTILDEGSIWNTEDAVILVRGAQNSTYTVSGAEMNPANGVIFQMMDDDDGYGTSGAGGDTSGEQGYAKWTGEAWGMPTFSTGFADPNEAGFVAPAQGGAYNTTLDLITCEDGEEVTYTGDVYNGTGTGAGTTAGGLMVNIGDDVTLEGAISSTSAVHGLPYSAEAVEYLDTLAKKYGDGVLINGGEPATVEYVLLDAEGNVTEDAAEAAYIQITEFTANEYYIISHVVNQPMDGANVMVKVAEDAAWDVTSDSYITALVNDGTVTVADGATLYVGGEAYTGEVPAGELGNLSAGAGAKIDTSAWVVGENYRTEATGNYDNIVIDGNAYYYVGYSEPVTGVAILDVAFQHHGWLVVDEDGNYTVSEEYVALEEPASDGGESGGESAEGESEGEEPAEGESAEGESAEGESAEGESAEGESAEGEAPAAPADDKAAASEEEILEAYKQYMTDWINAENEINETMTDEQLPEFLACIEANDYSQFPGDMFFSGMLESGAAMTYEEFAAVYKPAASADDKAAASEDDMLEAYKQYMRDWLNAENEINETMTDEQLPEFLACIEANDYSQFPGDMFFSGMLESGAAMTYEEFVAASK